MHEKSCLIRILYGFTGWKALTVLRSSARKNIGDGRYKKRGDYETAVKDFLNAHPHNIKEFETPEGVCTNMLTGNARFVENVSEINDPDKSIILI